MLCIQRRRVGAEIAGECEAPLHLRSAVRTSDAGTQPAPADDGRRSFVGGDAHDERPEMVRETDTRCTASMIRP